MIKKVLLDNSVISSNFIKILNCQRNNFEFYITSRTHVKNDYKQKTTWLKVIGEPARWGHSIWGSGEVWASEEDRELSNKLLAIAASQTSSGIKSISTQTTYNQRDDGDIIVCALNNKFDYLISDDKKFMLNDAIIKFTSKRGLKILSSKGFQQIIESLK